MTQTASHPTRLRRAPARLAWVLACLLPAAGVSSLRAAPIERWGFCGAWVLPVGDRFELGVPAADGGPAYRVTRNLIEGGPESREHQGADLSCGHGGDLVRAAANGWVMRAGWRRGYGRHLVLAHRFSDGMLAYSVYAHVAPKSLRVRSGQMVRAGQPLGRVGMSGRATSPHLHFEVRVAESPDQGWEQAPMVDPLAFVAKRLPSRRADTTWARPYLEWAESAALAAWDGDANEDLRRGEWWRMLAASGRHDLAALPGHAENLRAALASAGLLPADEKRGEHGRVAWSEVARDLGGLKQHGLRLPPSPVGREERRAECGRRLGLESPARDFEALGRDRDDGPTRAEACLALADLAGDPPAARKRKARPAG